MESRPTELFGIGSVFFLLIGSITLLVFSKYPRLYIDIQVHDTYFVVDRAHLCFLFAIVFVIFAIIYFLYRKFVGRYLNQKLSRVHFWSTFIGLLLLFYFIIKAQDATSKYYASGGAIEEAPSNEMTIIVFTFLMLAQLIFIFNFIYSLWKGEKV